MHDKRDWGQIFHLGSLDLFRWPNTDLSNSPKINLLTTYSARFSIILWACLKIYRFSNGQILKEVLQLKIYCHVQISHFTLLFFWGFNNIVNVHLMYLFLITSVETYSHPLNNLSSPIEQD